MFGLLANALYTMHQGQSGGRGLSPRLWAKARGQMLTPDGFNNAYADGDDFVRFGTIAPSAGGTTGGFYNGYAYYVDTSTNVCSIQQIATEVGGVIRFQTSADDNDDANLQAGGTAGVFGKVDSSDPQMLIFETRVRFTQVTNTYNWFVGLSEEGCSATDGVFTDAGAMADKDRLGFWVLEADGDALVFGYKKAGQTIQSLGTATAISAATWYKLGFIYDPDQPPSRRIVPYINNEELASTSFISDTNIAAATFPMGEEMSFLAGIKNQTTSAQSVDMDWWFAFQNGLSGS